jgi:hypothetical protein
MSSIQPAPADRHLPRGHLLAPASVGTAAVAASDRATGGEQRAADQQHDRTPQITTRCS